MANPGNAWHLPAAAEPRGTGSMLGPTGAVVDQMPITIISGNQDIGGGNQGNQLQDGSAVLYRATTDAMWTEIPMVFKLAADNNKYYSAVIPGQTFPAGATVLYYLRIAYSDRDLTFILSSGDVSVVTTDESVAQSNPFRSAVLSAADLGSWSAPFALPNVAIHTHLLPDGSVLMWGRRRDPQDDLNTRTCAPFVWNPVTGTSRPTAAEPTAADGSPVNLFCSGHAFLPDGRLLVAGGHNGGDGVGLDQACLYDWATDTWSATGVMNDGRWYPTVVALPDGTALVASGSITQNGGGQQVNNAVPQRWSAGSWTPLAVFPQQAMELYPRMTVASDGLVWVSGPAVFTWSLDTAGGGTWNQPPGVSRPPVRQYAPAVMMAPDQILYLGGGNDLDGGAPSDEFETLQVTPGTGATWSPRGAMNFPRRQHNATILADGSLMVTGGTRGAGFNDLDAGQPVHVAEHFDPSTRLWTNMAAEDVDRCYHATALLLPDGRVLSAGGGEFFAQNNVPNQPQDSHSDAQIFSPAYLHRGPRPTIDSAPVSVGYGQQVRVATGQAAAINRVNWIRLGSVTHSFNMNQRITTFSDIRVDAGDLVFNSPASAGACLPGHYLMFLIDRNGVPSVASIIQLTAPVVAIPAVVRARANLLVSQSPSGPAIPVDTERVPASQDIHHQVLVGITGTCPYGLAACWGGANEALLSLPGVADVDQRPDTFTSTAIVHTATSLLPDIDRWFTQFRLMVAGTYHLRGVEVTLRGSVSVANDGAFYLTPDPARTSRVRLLPLQPHEKIQWDRETDSPSPMTVAESAAFDRVTRPILSSDAPTTCTVTGPLTSAGELYELHVRKVDFNA